LTAILFDTGSGRLQLDQPSFDCLVAWARGHENPGPELLALRDAGAVQSSGPHPALARALRAVTEPVCTLRLRLADEETRLKAAEGWVSGDTAALLLDLPEPESADGGADGLAPQNNRWISARGPRDFLTVPPDFLPAALARVVRLGPRPRARPEPVNVVADLLDVLLAFDPVQRRDGAERLADILGRAAGRRLASPSRIWQARMTWSGPGDSLTTRSLYVVDSETGMFLAEFEDRRATLWPTTPTVIWRLLIRLLPDTVELG
jgi:hypothetical protein